jgi:hypothetical protein
LIVQVLGGTMRRLLTLTALIAAMFVQVVRADVPEAIPDDAQFAAFVGDKLVKYFDGSTFSVDAPDQIKLTLPKGFLRQPVNFITVTIGVNDLNVNPNKFVVTVPPSKSSPLSSEGPSLGIDLTRVHDACRKQPSGCSDAIAQLFNGAFVYLEKMQAALDSVNYRRPDLDRTKIAASIVTDWTVRNMVVQDQSKTRRIVTPLFGKLWVGCQPDVPAFPAYVMQKDLESLNLSADDATALCQHNTMAEQPAFGQSLRVVSPGEVGVLSSNNEAVLVLFHEQWGLLADRMNTDLILSVPDANTILYTASATPAAIRALVDRERYLRANKLPIVPPTIYRWTKTGWDIVYPEK